MDELNMRGAEQDLLKALNENTDTQGGYLVPEIWSSKLYDLIMAKSTAVQLCESVIMTSDVLHFPKVTTASTAYFVAEAGTITASQPSFGQLTMTAKKVAGLARLSSEVMEDSNPSILGVVMERLAEDISLKIDYAIYNGTTTDVGFVGMRENTLVSSVDVDDELSTDHISDAIQELQVENIEPTDLIIHPKVLNRLRKLKVSTTSNEPLLNVTTFGDPTLANGQVGKIWGVNVIVTTQLPTDLTGTVVGYTENLTDAILVARGKCGVFARRREMRMSKFYLIDTDDWKIQANMRAAFEVNYEKAICLIHNIYVG